MERQGDGSQPGPSGRGRGSGRGSRGRGQPRQPRRAQVQAVTATLNPMASDFSLLSVPDRLEQVRIWMRRFDLVRRRPQFRVILVETLIQAENGEPQILRIWFRGGFVLDGTFHDHEVSACSYRRSRRPKLRTRLCGTVFYHGINCSQKG